MVIAGYAFWTHVQTTTSRQLNFAIGPDRKILLGLTPLKRNVHGLYGLTFVRGAVKQRSKKDLEYRRLVFVPSAVRTEIYDSRLSHF